MHKCFDSKRGHNDNNDSGNRISQGRALLSFHFENKLLVQLEIEDGATALVVRHQEIIFAVQLLQRHVAEAGPTELFILRGICHFSM